MNENRENTHDMLASASFTKESIERIITTANSFVRWHLTIRLNAMLQTVQLPASVTDLNASLSNMHGDTFTLYGKKRNKV